MNIIIREPTLEDMNSFIDAMRDSESMHRPWVKAPKTSMEFSDYFMRSQQSTQKSFLVCNESGNIVGVFNVNEIVRGFFQCAYLGFYVVANFACHGYMSAGIKLVSEKVFNEMKLHRLETNIQPENIRSINLVKNNGFRKEGYSPHYLQINNEWRDHERWAMTLKDFKAINKAEKIDKLGIVTLQENQINEIVSAFKKIGWNKPVSIYKAYIRQESQNLRSTFFASINGQFCGYVTIKWKSDYQSFGSNNTPEICDLNVLPDFRKKGIGTLLIQHCENSAKNNGYTEIGLGVGLTADYGDAQRLYIRLGFVPDGQGLHYKYKIANYSEKVIVDDDLLIFLSKKLNKAIDSNVT